LAITWPSPWWATVTTCGCAVAGVAAVVGTTFTGHADDVHGINDLLVRLRLRDTAHLRDVLFERIWTVPGVDRTETYVSLGEMVPKAIDVLLIDGLLAQVQAQP